MSKEYARLSIEEVMSIASNHMEEDAVHAQVVLDFAADIEKEVASRCRAQGGSTSEEDKLEQDYFDRWPDCPQAAANKAAEEGELRKLIKNVADASFRAGKSGEDIFNRRSSLEEMARRADEKLVEYFHRFIAADRAARPVANKAEVEPLLYALKQIRGYREDVSKSIAADSMRFIADLALQDYASPPVTTGASTDQRPTDDELWDATLRDRDAYHEWADKLADAIAKHFGVDIGEHSNKNLPWAEALEAIENAEPVGASTVLTDERIEAMAAEIEEKDDLIARLRRQVDAAVERGIDVFGAAQAGEVAVPGGSA